MKKDGKASISLIKFVVISIILFIVFSGIGVMAVNTSLSNVKIVLANGYEMDTVTAKTKVADILNDAHITLTEEEKVVPGLEEEISDNKTIKITKQEEILPEEVQPAEANTVSMDELLKEYAPITEKIITEQIEIPFETITKDISDGGNKQNKVIQEGQNGLKEVTYQVKYQNDVEIERIELSSTVIKEPVNKIVQIQTQVSSRASTAVSYGNGRWSYSAKELDLLCAITAQECSSSYEGALAVITCACNRAESSKWRSKGTDPLSQYKAKGQFCYSIDSNWKKRLNGNYTAAVKQAVLDALNGKRNHNYLSFRSARSYSGGVNIGGNAYFNPM
mgnify:FL=1